MEIARWRREESESAIVITPPEGGASITIRERQPFRSLRGAEVVALAELFDEPTPKLTTAEGELAAIIDHESGSRAVVWNDFDQTELVGTAKTEAARKAVYQVMREVVYQAPFGPGLERARRFWYRPPAGWTGRARGLVADWTSPEGDARLKILPARPSKRSREAIAIEQFLHDDPFRGFVLAPPIEQTPLVLGTLRGVRATATGHELKQPRTYITIAVEDARVTYTVRLECKGEVGKHDAVLEALLASIEPVPAIRESDQPRPAIGDAVMAHWAT
ncbi:MAG TPA: hypothetical protein VGC41_14965 [Kofleriaceae bacterium]